MTNRFLIFFLLLAALSLPQEAAANNLCPPQMGKWAVLAGGRIQPLELHARQSLKMLTGKNRWKEGPALEIYCRLSAFSWGREDASLTELEIEIGHRETRLLLNLEPPRTSVPISELLRQEKTLQLARDTLNHNNENPSLKKDLEKQLARLGLWKKIVGGNDWKIPLASKGASTQQEAGWLTFAELAPGVSTLKGGGSSVYATLMEYEEQWVQDGNDRHRYEYEFYRLHLYHWALLVLLGTLLLAAARSRWNHPLVWTGVGIGLGLETLGLIFRIWLSGRAPVTNMYETVLWAGVTALFFAALMAWKKKEKGFLLAGLGLNVGALFMMNFAHGMLDPSLKPLVPVLRDNFWLSTHVTSITLSYGLFGLTWLLANGYLLRVIFGREKDNSARRTASLVYDCLKWGVLFLSLGILLGAVWADYSWGRFWGWDPKETWSLITLMIYITLLHGRFAGWVSPRRFLSLVTLGFLSVIMTWFGVNYLLVSGLHSYGFSQGGAAFVLLLFGAQVLLWGAYLFRANQGSWIFGWPRMGK